MDSVHQGDLDGKKGVYHINAVDEITQFQAVVCVEKISEAYLLVALQELFAAFPFVPSPRKASAVGIMIRGFHSDNGSEYVNYQVAKLLNKLLIDFTKSRSRRTNDNALVEGKNAATVRKHFGYAHIPQRFAALINEFNQQHLIPYLNFPRPGAKPAPTRITPAVLLSRNSHRRQRQTEKTLPLPTYVNTVREVQITAGSGPASQGGYHL